MEQWLEGSIASSNPMAYFLWDDDGVLSLVDKYEEDFVQDFVQVFSPVEKVDIFRIIVCKWFGGVVGAVLSFCHYQKITIYYYSMATLTQSPCVTLPPGFKSPTCQNGRTT
jgi:hypothetical protein